MNPEQPTAFLIKIIYKSGATHEFWAESFQFNAGTYSWKPAYSRNVPIVIGAGEIAAVWQIDHK